MDSLPQLPLELIFRNLDLAEQIKCRVLSKKCCFVIDKRILLDELTINLKSYNFRRSKNTWYDTQQPLSTDYTVSLNYALQKPHETSQNVWLKSTKFSGLKRLRLVFLSRYQNDKSNSTSFFSFVLTNLADLFDKLEHLELEINWETLSKCKGITHGNLSILYVNCLTKESKFRINCPKLLKLYWGGVLTDSLSFKHPNSIQHLEADFNCLCDAYQKTLPTLSNFNNLKHFHYFGFPSKLSAEIITKFNLDVLETFNYKETGDSDYLVDSLSGSVFPKMARIFAKKKELNLENLNICFNNNKIENENEIEKLSADRMKLNRRGYLLDY